MISGTNPPLYGTVTLIAMQAGTPKQRQKGTMNEPGYSITLSYCGILYLGSGSRIGESE